MSSEAESNLGKRRRIAQRTSIRSYFRERYGLFPKHNTPDHNPQQGINFPRLLLPSRSTSNDSQKARTTDSWSPGIPKEAFIDDRSRGLREICVDILRRMDQIMHYQLDAEQKGQYTAELERLGGRLIEHGVYRRIHCGTMHTEADLKDPVMVVEWVAGNFLYQYTGHTPVTTKHVRVISSEHAVASISDSQLTAYLIPTEKLHHKVVDWSMAEWAGINAMHYLSIDTNELEFPRV